MSGRKSEGETLRGTQSIAIPYTVLPSLEQVFEQACNLETKRLSLPGLCSGSRALLLLCSNLIYNKIIQRPFL